MRRIAEGERGAHASPYQVPGPADGAPGDREGPQTGALWPDATQGLSVYASRSSVSSHTGQLAQESINTEIEHLNEGISRTRSRIVQSPERIRNNIRTMGVAAAEDKRTVTMRETKVRDLQMKITALQSIDNVCTFTLFSAQLAQV